MSISYPAQYKDKFGSESTTIIDEGRTIRLSLRGVEFSGTYFSLAPVSETSSIPSQLFQLFEDELCAYSLDFELPIVVANKGKELETKLHIQVECGEPVEATGWTVWKRHKDGRIAEEIERIDNYSVLLEIELEHNIYRASNLHGDFEKPLIELSKQFPPEVYLKICLNCGLSEYPSVFAGSLGCFRNARSEQKQVAGKWDFFKLYTEKAIEVHETYLCLEFERRKPSA